jgi:N-acetylglucosaminyldiphosphoundecaprenol N-acetyl-beta-D-mannosaminyltransferase
MTEPHLNEFLVLGVHVNAVQIPDVISKMEAWVAHREPVHYIAVTGMHGITEALHDADFRRILNQASLVVPDGYPLVVLGRRKGFPLARRVYGPELMVTFCRETASRGYRHFFYGSAPGVAEDLSQRFVAQFPGLLSAGAFSPPYRPLRPDEEAAICNTINAAQPDVLWVGLSTPKQEKWMAAFRERLRVPVMVGVGAAFDFHTGRISQAPAWMRENGLEWSYRLFQEPKRLWRRYLLGGSEFVFNVALQELGLRKFD